ncbi:MAG: TlpA disulfide reductase family protein [Bacteroidota bacterium]
MKHNYSLLFSLLLFIAFGSVMYGQNSFPSVSVKTFDGQNVDIQDYVLEQDKMTILTFWASWCKPCQKEMDNLAYLLPEWQEEYDVQVVAVTIDEVRNLGKAKSIAISKEWEYTFLSDSNQQSMRQLNFQAIPQTFLIDKEGKIIYSHTGYVDGDEYKLEEKIKAGK